LYNSTSAVAESPPRYIEQQAFEEIVKPPLLSWDFRPFIFEPAKNPRFLQLGSFLPAATPSGRTSLVDIPTLTEPNIGLAFGDIRLDYLCACNHQARAAIDQTLIVLIPL